MSLIDKSFYLIRTNSALTGNVKIVINKNNKIFLESFNANNTLRKDRFKHFEIKKVNTIKKLFLASSMVLIIKLYLR